MTARYIARWVGEGNQPRLAHSDDAGFDLAYHGQDPIEIWPNETIDEHQQPTDPDSSQHDSSDS